MCILKIVIAKEGTILIFNYCWGVKFGFTIFLPPPPPRCPGRNQRQATGNEAATLASSQWARIEWWDRGNSPPIWVHDQEISALKKPQSSRLNSLRCFVSSQTSSRFSLWCFVIDVYNRLLKSGVTNVCMRKARDRWKAVVQFLPLPTLILLVWAEEPWFEQV